MYTLVTPNKVYNHILRCVVLWFFNTIQKERKKTVLWQNQLVTGWFNAEKLFNSFKEKKTIRAIHITHWQKYYSSLVTELFIINNLSANEPVNVIKKKITSAITMIVNNN